MTTDIAKDTSAPLKTNCILAISNDQSFTTTLKNLTKTSYYLIITENIAGARKIIKEKKPTIAILDLNTCQNMVCGKESLCFECKDFITLVNKEYITLYILLASRHADDEEIEKIKKISDIVLSRPVDFNKLMLQIESSVRLHKLEEEIIAQDRMLYLLSEEKTFETAELTTVEIKETALALIKQFRQFAQHALESERQKTEALRISQIQLKETNDQLQKVLKELKIQMEKAAEIQQSLIPQKGIETEEFDIKGMLLPAQDVAGDYYDYILYSAHNNRNGYRRCLRKRHRCRDGNEHNKNRHTSYGKRESRPQKINYRA